MAEQETTHTPGPWTCECVDGYWMIYGSDGFQIHNTFNSTDAAQVEANRRLIEGAPTLLNAHAGLTAAVEQALAVLNEWPPSEWGYRETQIADVLTAALKAAKS